MEQKDIELINKHSGSDESLKSLYKEHLDYENQLDEYNNKSYLTPAEEVERKQIQKKKLKGKDEIESILTKYRSL